MGSAIIASINDLYSSRVRLSSRFLLVENVGVGFSALARSLGEPVHAAMLPGS